jgi:hypothetical protein
MVGGAVLLDSGTSRALPDSNPAQWEIVSNTMIWSNAAHNGFPDICEWDGNLYAAIREATEHASYDGDLRILRSTDAGTNWTSVALLGAPGNHDDVRGSRFATNAAGALIVQGSTRGLATDSAWVTATATLGTNWSAWVSNTPPTMLLWQAAWKDGTAYTFGRTNAGDSTQYAGVWTSHNHTAWTEHAAVTSGIKIAEPAVWFEGETLHALVRRTDTGTHTDDGSYWTGEAPYTNLTHYRTLHQIEDPTVLPLGGDWGTVVGARKLWDTDGNEQNTYVWRWEASTRFLRPMLRLDSIVSDCGYTGLVQDGNDVLVIYYHGSATAAGVWLARIRR